MGDVYMAHDSRLNRNVAIKVIAAESGADESKRRHFTQEARAASCLNHPNIVTVHDFGTDHGMSYIVSELIEGESLRSRIKRGPLPLKQLVDIGIQVAEGLAAAHEAGIVHRDLKPENIMITRDGRAKILDFGVAKLIVEEQLEGATLSGDTLDQAGDATVPGLILGTVGYMSPEQARGAPVGPQSDQFSLGILLHEMATGHQPFRGATPMETLLRIANIERPPFTPGPVAFRMLVDRCLAREPEKRLPHTGEIVQRLRRIREQLPDSEPKQAAAGGIAPSAQARGRWWQAISPRVMVAIFSTLALAAGATLVA
jgi:serine/threonine protein kinase